MPRSPQPDPIFRAKESFAFTDPGGVMRVVHIGELLAPDDIAVKTHRDLVEPVTSTVEQTTNAPGEVRAVRIPVPEGASDAAPEPV